MKNTVGKGTIVSMDKVKKIKYNMDNLARLRVLELVISVAVILTLVFTLVIGIATVSGSSMYPTLRDGQPVIFYRLEKDYSRGDVISVHMPNGEYLVKRVIAVAGDTVDLRGGVIYINGRPEEGNYPIGDTQPQKQSVEFPMLIEEGKIFILGDNREVSVDSRTYGQFAVSQTRGRLLFTE